MKGNVCSVRLQVKILLLTILCKVEFNAERDMVAIFQILMLYHCHYHRLWDQKKGMSICIIQVCEVCQKEFDNVHELSEHVNEEHRNQDSGIRIKTIAMKNNAYVSFVDR